MKLMTAPPSIPFSLSVTIEDGLLDGARAQRARARECVRADEQDVDAFEILRARHAAHDGAPAIDGHARQQAFEVHGDVIGAADRDDEGRTGGRVGPLDVLREPEQIGRLDGIDGNWAACANEALKPAKTTSNKARVRTLRVRLKRVCGNPKPPVSVLVGQSRLQWNVFPI